MQGLSSCKIGACGEPVLRKSHLCMLPAFIERNIFGRPTRRRNYISTGQLFGIEYVATATTLILDSRRECRDKAFARQALGSFFARSRLDFPLLFPHQLTKLIPICIDRCCPFFAFPTYSCSCAQAMENVNGTVWFRRCFHDPSFPSVLRRRTAMSKVLAQSPSGVSKS